jgi:twitching motility protein PilT
VGRRQLRKLLIRQFEITWNEGTDRMISNILLQIKNRMSQEVQFRLGHKTLIKIENEWYEFDEQVLSVSDWEDLKDLCLQNSEKVTLETKGFAQGIFSDPTQNWFFSFTEWKDCLRAHFTFIQKDKKSASIQYSPFYDNLKKKSGIHIISGLRRSGKSTLLSEIVSESRKHSPELVAVHALPSQMSLTNLDSVVHLGMESLDWDFQHPIYDGIDSIVVDANEIKNLNKWTRFAEEGRTIYISLSGHSIENVLLQIKSITQDQQSLRNRFCELLRSVVYQKIVHGTDFAVHEVWILKKEDQKKLVHHFPDGALSENISSAALYQSLNQSILQSLVRRKLDVKKAFEISDDIENLDLSLKKMGL